MVLQSATASTMSEASANSDHETSANDVRIARIHKQIHLWEAFINGVTSVFMVASLGIPMYFVYQCVVAIAGKTTVVSSNIVFTVSGLAALGTGSAVGVGGWAKLNAQRKELVRLRSLVTRLEDRLKKQQRRGRQ